MGIIIIIHAILCAVSMRFGLALIWLRLWMCFRHFVQHKAHTQIIQYMYKYIKCASISRILRIYVSPFPFFPSFQCSLSGFYWFLKSRDFGNGNSSKSHQVQARSTFRWFEHHALMLRRVYLPIFCCCWFERCFKYVMLHFKQPSNL